MTARKSARFRVGRCLSPYPVHYSRAFAFSAFLYPQRQQRSLRFACHCWRRYGLTHVPHEYPSGADPSASPAVVLSMMVQSSETIPHRVPFWFKPVSTFGLFKITTLN